MRSRSDKLPQGRYSVGGKTDAYPRRIGWWDRTPLPRDESDVEITITPRYDKRPDLLAYDLYGRSGLAWVVLQFNTILDINVEFVSGKTIVVPTKVRLLTQLLTPSR